MEIKCIKSEEVKLDYVLMKKNIYIFIILLTGLLKIYISRFWSWMGQLSTNWK